VTESPALPSVSIVIPARNEVNTIEATLDSCVQQPYEGSLEVIVADAMSDDGTRDIVERFGRDHAVRLVDNVDRTTPAGLNRAIEASDADVIVRCDAHSVLPDGYVRDAVRTLIGTGAGNVGGIQHAVGTTSLQRGIAAAMTNPLGVGDAKFHRGGSAGPVDTVYLGVYPRKVLEEVGGFDESLVRNQDYELNVRIRNAGHTVWFDPHLVVDYQPRASLGALWRQYSDYGRGKRRVVAMHPSSLKPRQAAPPVLVIGLVASGVSLATPLRKAGAAVLVGYAAALGLASLYETATKRDAAALLTGPAIGVMHVAWGIGFLRGSRSQ
jgi:cellulose synthase/poly-beta-1,6-N-acetylglucosamine synthase-like glycosyltransferase